MTVSEAGFRANFPAFVNVTTFPSDSVNFWLSVAALMLPITRWGASAVAPAPAGGPITSMLDLGMMLFAAHNLILEAQAAKAAAGSGGKGIPGMSTGPVSSKTIGPVSQSYDSQAGIELEAGHWNLTVYGTRFVRLAMMVGSASIGHVGGAQPYGQYSGAGWVGPLNQWPGW